MVRHGNTVLGGNWRCYLILAAMISLLLQGCSKSASDSPTSNAPTPKAESSKPVTLKIMKGQTAETEDDAQKYYIDPIKKKFPNITLQYVELAKGQTLQDLLTSGEFPDIVFTGKRGMAPFLDLDSVLDLNDMVKKNGLDVTKYDKVAFASSLSDGPKGELYSLPYLRAYYLTVYNKDIFDKFGVPYPKDSMTWEDVTKVAKLTSKTDGGNQYRGVDPGNLTLTARGLSLTFVDPKTNKSIISNDSWKRVFEVARDMYLIPSNTPTADQFSKGINTFYTDKNIAMLPYYSSPVISKFENLGDKQPFNWDIVTYPSFSEAKGKTAETDSSVFMISKISKNKEEAFQVINYLSTNEELQIAANKDGRGSGLKIDGSEKTFGQNINTLKGKNVAGIFKSSLRELPPASIYDDFARKTLNNAFKDVLYKGVDVITALRNADDALNKNIAM